LLVSREIAIVPVALERGTANPYPMGVMQA
jgi:hypothetical protein